MLVARICGAMHTTQGCHDVIMLIDTNDNRKIDINSKLSGFTFGIICHFEDHCNLSSTVDRAGFVHIGRNDSNPLEANSKNCR